MPHFRYLESLISEAIDPGEEIKNRIASVKDTILEYRPSRHRKNFFIQREIEKNRRESLTRQLQKVHLDTAYEERDHHSFKFCTTT